MLIHFRLRFILSDQTFCSLVLLFFWFLLLLIFGWLGTCLFAMLLDINQVIEGQFTDFTLPLIQGDVFLVFIGDHLSELYRLLVLGA